jgi:hypothetical protein
MDRIVLPLLVLGLLIATAICGCSAKPKSEQTEPTPQDTNWTFAN